MNRLQALEAVATRVRIWCATRPELNKGFDTFHDTQALFDAITALDALPADPDPARGEVVEVELWAHRDGDICVLLPGCSIAKDWETNQFRRRLGTTLLPLVKGAGA